MSKNVGTIDRILRVLIAIAAIAAVFFSPLAASGEWGVARILLVAVGAIMLLTSAISFCPLYRILGIRTCTPSS